MMAQSERLQAELSEFISRNNINCFVLPLLSIKDNTDSVFQQGDSPFDKSDRQYISVNIGFNLSITKN